MFVFIFVHRFKKMQFRTQEYDQNSFKDLTTACADFNRILVLNSVMAQMKNGFFRMHRLVEGIKSTKFIEEMNDQIDSNYKILYDMWSSNQVQEYNEVEGEANVEEVEEVDEHATLKNQFHAYKKELEILNKIKKFIEDDIRIKDVILSVVSHAIDEEDEEEGEGIKFSDENKDKYYNDYYVLYDIVRLFGDDHTLVLLDNLITLEKVENRIKTCYESMGWIANEIM